MIVGVSWVGWTVAVIVFCTLAWWLVGVDESSTLIWPIGLFGAGAAGLFADDLWKRAHH
jgi:hypothetical protein